MRRKKRNKVKREKKTLKNIRKIAEKKERDGKMKARKKTEDKIKRIDRSKKKNMKKESREVNKTCSGEK